MLDIKNSGMTITGFSKSGFGCCSNSAKCEMGRKECIYASTDSEVLTLCAAYKRHHKKAPFQTNQSITIIESPLKPVSNDNQAVSIQKNKNIVLSDPFEISSVKPASEQLKPNDNGQLTLF